MSTCRVPVLDIYRTCQGQGPRTGEPVTIIRVHVPEEWKYIWMQPMRAAQPVFLPLKEVVERVTRLNVTWIFFSGEDPCMLQLPTICKALHEAGHKVWIDATGVYHIPLESIDYLSLGPKPGLPYHALTEADDLRFYFDDKDGHVWRENIDRVMSDPDYNGCPVFIAPRRLNQECIDSVISYVLASNDPRLHLDLPLYRILPDFDKNFLNVQGPTICTLMDRQQQG